ncbi:uncharacterized protein MKZ38_002491 [Zalerion maritima]|uniref:Uncharacterized protein n=1 Tax=Zalerion maritima TaxID=339359 RepID=A0AAD5RNU0_9PEZI|nr:uncharacterized protein MKZ38_002491 [Zalerion maritima]
MRIPTGALRPWGRPWFSGSQRRAASSKWSYDEGSTEIPLLPHTIPEHFAEIVSKYGDKPAVSARAPYSTLNPLPNFTAYDTISTSTFAPPPLETLTYSDLDRLSSRLAIALRGLGIEKGDRVAVSLGNCLEFAALTYAVFKIGAVLAPLNPAFTGEQVQAALNHLEAKMLVMGKITDLAYKPGRGRSNFSILEGLVPGLAPSTASNTKRPGVDGTGDESTVGGKEIQSAAVPSLKRVVLVDNSLNHPESLFPNISPSSLTPYHGLLRETSSPLDSSTHIVPSSPLLPDDVINIQFTSGTTAHPKAAQLTHTGILNNGHLIASRMGLVPADRIIVPPPLFHCFGCILGYMATATMGASIIFPSPAFDPRATLTTLRETQGEGCYGVGTMMVAMLELLSDAEALSSKIKSTSSSLSSSSSSSNASSPANLSPAEQEVLAWSAHPFPAHLSKGIVAGSLVQQALMEKLLSRLGFRHLVICYGMTETSPVSIMTSPSDPTGKRTGTVGKVMPHTAIRIVDPNDRTRVLPRGEPGELATAGYCVMKGYFGDEEQTKEAFLREEGWSPEAASPEKGPGPDRGAHASRTWMHTGDEAVMDPQGYVRITGRIKDLIIRGGENIHPVEIENCLFTHPKIMEVSVVGVKDDKLGEAVVAFVIPHHSVTVEGGMLGEGGVEGGRGGGAGSGKGEEELEVYLTKDGIREWVRSRLSGHLVPKYVFWVKEYPKTSSGKIQKFKLRKMADRILHGDKG